MPDRKQKRLVCALFLTIVALYSFISGCLAENYPSSASALIIHNSEDGHIQIIDELGRVVFSEEKNKVELAILSPDVICIKRLSEEGRDTCALCGSEGMLTGFDYTYIDTATPDNIPRLAIDSTFNYGYIDRYGNWTISPSPDWIYAEPFSEGLALIQTETSIGFIDMQGQMKIQFSDEEIYTASSFSEGKSAVGFSDGTWGFIDTDGNIINRNLYVETYNYHDGIARVADQKGYFYNDHDENPISADRWNEAQDFEYGYAIVGQDREHQGIINHQGELVLPLCASWVMVAPNQTCWFSQGQPYLFRLFDLPSQRFLSDEFYEMPYPYEEGFSWCGDHCVVKQNGLFGMIDSNGVLKIPCQYVFLSFDEDGQLQGSINGMKSRITIP